MPNKKPINDFDPEQVVKVDRYDEDISRLTKRIDSLEKRFGTNEQIADTLSETAEKATKMQEMLSSSFLKQIKTNQDIKDALKKLMNETDRNAVNSLLKKFGYAIGAIILSLISGLIGYLIKQ